MCRLFGLTAGATPTQLTYWLLDAPDSLDRQSFANPDGCGLGWFGADGAAHVAKSPLAAHDDVEFAREARDIVTTSCVAHVRFATTGGVSMENAHPFVMDDRIFAHNGAVGDLPALEAHLGEDLAAVRGQTDSERIFALVTREIRARGGDVEAGLVAALEWVVASLPVVSVNCVLAAADTLYALRYPALDGLFLFEPDDGDPARDLRSSLDFRIRARDADQPPAVVVASEPLDGGRWTEIPPGQLVTVGPGLEVRRRQVFPAGAGPEAAEATEALRHGG